MTDKLKAVITQAEQLPQEDQDKTRGSLAHRVR